MANNVATTEGSFSFVIFLILYSFCVFSARAIDTIGPQGILRNNEILVSQRGVFELGFFSDPSGNRFLGIWFHDDPNKKVVWVANRGNPLLDDSSCFLEIWSDGNLMLMDRRQIPLIVNSGGIATSGNTSATLLDSGNFFLQEGDNIIWQSFDYPVDTYLPGMKLGWFGSTVNYPQRLQLLMSWISPQSPVTGNFALGVDYMGATVLGVWRNDTIHQDIGSWNGKDFGFFFPNSSNSFKFSYVSSENETSLAFETTGNYSMSWLVLSSSGGINEYVMSRNGSISMVSHSLCGLSNLVNSSALCWGSLPSMCGEGDTFSAMNGSLPTSVTQNGSIIVGSNCESSLCQSNCSCTAFASVTDGQNGCQLYYGSKNALIDHLVQKGGGGGVVYVRGAVPTKVGISKRNLVLILVGALFPLVLAIVLALWCCKFIKRRNLKSTAGQVKSPEEGTNSVEVTIFPPGKSLTTRDVVPTATILELGGEKDHELPLFSFSTIETATQHFALANILGEGGFGLVYKGELPQGQEIAVKRLSKKSGQGLMEFKNEISLISKLQHRNLVRILGCCIEGEENILVYEYMPNKSLDSFIFDATKRELLDWKKRVKIIEGIAQGILYLHKYSRLRIIHRDLKTSNILLDGDMNPKISDFGMARIFGDSENRAKTNKIAGTFGYMSPEYAMDGLFSEKSDVFSFGIIVLEIVSGKRNISFFETDQSRNLLRHAWSLSRDGKSTEVMDPTLVRSCSTSEVSRYIQLGLLCVQERAADRPSMSTVVSMLSNEIIALPNPREPAFVSYYSSDADSSSFKQGYWSKNEITGTELCGR